MADLAAGEGLHISSAVVRIRLDTDSDYQDMGEYATLQITPSITTLPYFTRKTANRGLTTERVTRSAASFTLGVNSLTARNMSIALGGTQSTVGAGHTRVTFLETAIREVDLRIEGVNDQGNMIDFTGRISIRPGQTLDLAQDEWSIVTMEGQVLVNNESHFGWYDIRTQGTAYAPPAAGSA